MACTGRYAEAADYEALLCGGIDLTNAAQVAMVEAYLDLAASDIHMHLASVGACDCTISAFGLVYLKKLNILDAAVIQQCPCGKIDKDQKQMWLEWLDRQFTLIRSGEIELCDGYTGSEYPAFGAAERSLTAWSEAEIILHKMQRES